MNRSSGYAIVLFLASLLILSAGCTSQGQPSLPATSVPSPAAVTTPFPGPAVTNETLVAFVEHAAAYAKAVGPEKALAEFSNRNGSFIDGELYIYAYGYNGTTLAHPVNPETVGKQREGAPGVFVREMGAVVRNGSGWYRFTYINPLHNNTLESKIGYGIQVADDWWIGSGIYAGPVVVSPAPGTMVVTPAGTPAQVTRVSNETLIAFVDSAVAFAGVQGKEKALAEFSNRNGSFVRGELYIFAYDFNSTVLAHPFSPEKIGTSRASEPDAFGNQYSQAFINAARNGSGFVRFPYPNPRHNNTLESKLGYVKKVDETWWLGSGIYTGPA